MLILPAVLWFTDPWHDALLFVLAAILYRPVIDLIRFARVNKVDLQGVIAATVTPMDDDGDIDEASLRTYIRWLVGQGVHGVARRADEHLGHTRRGQRVRESRRHTPARDLTPMACRTMSSASARRLR